MKLKYEQGWKTKEKLQSCTIVTRSQQVYHTLYKRTKKYDKYNNKLLKYISKMHKKTDKFKILVLPNLSYIWFRK